MESGLSNFKMCYTYNVLHVCERNSHFIASQCNKQIEFKNGIPFNNSDWKNTLKHNVSGTINAWTAFGSVDR